tara:strand:- start:2276 stop:3010 length:735 start_codon:yes stop_codon:yes gene_type:complete
MHHNKVGVIIEARSNSSRLKNKHFLKVNKKPIIQYMINRIKLIKNIDEIIIATTKRKDDNKFVKFCAKENIKIFRGSENNVMSRVLKAAKKFKISTICEITGDCPIVDYEIVDKLIKNFLNSKFDYFSMKGSGYPHGIGAQIFKLKTLSKSYSMTKKKNDLENVTTHIKRNKKIFKIKFIKAPKKLRYPSIKLLLDEELDYLFLKKILIFFNKKKNLFFKTKDIIRAINKKEINLINSNVIRNK